LGFCILLRVLYQGYWKNRRSQQLFKVFIYTYFAGTCFGPRWPSSGAIHNIFGKLTHAQDRLCGLVVRVLGYRSGGPGSIPGTTRFSEKKKKENK
jgi:hypothetical protein